jgi:hypothetical protein
MTFTLVFPAGALADTSEEPEDFGSFLEPPLLSEVTASSEDDMPGPEEAAMMALSLAEPEVSKSAGEGGTILWSESNAAFEVSSSLPGYVIDSVTIDNKDMDGVRGLASWTATSEPQQSIKATFAYTLGILASGGTVTVTRGENELQDGAIVRLGDVLRIATSGDEGNTLYELKTMGLEDQGDGSYRVTAALGAAAPSVTANFTDLSTMFKVNIGAADNGSVKAVYGAEGAPVVSGQTLIAKGTQVTLTVTPLANYQLRPGSLTVGGEAVSPATTPFTRTSTYSFAIQEDTDVLAAFMPVARSGGAYVYHFAAGADDPPAPDLSGTLPASRAADVAYGDVLTVQAVLLANGGPIYGFTGCYGYTATQLEFLSAELDGQSGHTLSAVAADGVVRLSVENDQADEDGLPLALSRMRNSTDSDVSQYVTVTLRFEVLQQYDSEKPTLTEGASASTNAFVAITDPYFRLADLHDESGSYASAAPAITSALSAQKVVRHTAARTHTATITEFPNIQLAAGIAANGGEPVPGSTLDVAWDDEVTVTLHLTSQHIASFGFTGAVAYDSSLLQFKSAVLEGDSTAYPRLVSADNQAGANSAVRLSVENSGSVFLASGDTATVTLSFTLLDNFTKTRTVTVGASGANSFVSIADADTYLASLRDADGAYSPSALAAGIAAHRIFDANSPSPLAINLTSGLVFAEYRWDLRTASGVSNRQSADTIEVMPGDTVVANLLVTLHSADAYGFAGVIVYNAANNATANAVNLEFVSAELVGQGTGHVLKSEAVGTGAGAIVRLWVENDVVDAAGNPVPFAEEGTTVTIALHFKTKDSAAGSSAVSMRDATGLGYRATLFTDPSLTYGSLHDADASVVNENLIKVHAERRAFCFDQSQPIYTDSGAWYYLRDATIAVVGSKMPRGADIAWYLKDPNASEFHISTPAELYGLMYLVNRTESAARGVTFRYQTIYLDEDIDLAETAYHDDETDTDRRFGELWRAIGWGLSFYRMGTGNSSYFMGTFDGQGHTVSGLEKNGLFGDIESATIKNLKTSGTVINGGPLSASTSGSGVVLTATDSRLENLSSDVELIYDKALSGNEVGGIVGTVSGATVVSGCEFTGSFSKTAAVGIGTYGGIIGMVQVTSTAYGAEVTDCVNHADILGYYNSGGIVGGTKYVDTTNSDYSTTLVIRNCVNYGDVAQARGAFYMGIGGILGSSGLNYESMYFANFNSDLPVSITGCANYGSIKALDSNAGGIVGYAQQGDKLVLTDCYNRGAVSVNITRTQAITGAQAYYGSAGGIAGRVDGAGAYLDRSYSSGVVALGSAVGDSATAATLGGFAGRIEGGPQAGANYYLDSAAAAAVAGQPSGIATAKGDNEMRAAAFAVALGDAFVAVTGDYPVLWWLAEGYVRPPKPVPGIPVLNADGYYELATSEDLVWFANQVNSGSTNINAILTGRDYVLKSPGFQGIGGIVNGTVSNGTYTGVYTNSFGGIFEGNGATITLDLYSATGFIGLFGATDGATLMNFTVEGQVTSHCAAVGGVVGYALNTTIKNVINNANVTNRAGSDPTFGNPSLTTGGLVGYNGGGNEVANSYNTGIITISTGSGAGIIAGTTVLTGADGAFGRNNAFIDVNHSRDATGPSRPAPPNNAADPNDPFKIVNVGTDDNPDYRLYDSRTHEVVDGVIVARKPSNPDPGPGPGGGPGPSEPGDAPPSPSTPSAPSTPSSPSTPGVETAFPAKVATATENTATESTAQPEATPPSTPESPVLPEPEQQATPQQPLPEPETPQADSRTATEVALIPLGFGFETVANTLLTIAVGFIALGVFVLGGFIFWRMYRRRIDHK